jgi:MerR family transcriptional regulator, copper efflux regulator
VHIWPVNIGTAAQLSGLSAKMIRHYESLGLLPRITRSDSGYRQYSEADVHTLRFIQRARELGFSMVAIGELVALWQNRRRTSANVKRVAQKHLDELSARIAALESMQQTVKQLLQHCHGDERPDCPILQDLAEAHSPHALQGAFS